MKFLLFTLTICLLALGVFAEPNAKPHTRVPTPVLHKPPSTLTKSASNKNLARKSRPKPPPLSDPAPLGNLAVHSVPQSPVHKPKEVPPLNDPHHFPQLNKEIQHQRDRLLHVQDVHEKQYAEVTKQHRQIDDNEEALRRKWREYKGVEGKKGVEETNADNFHAFDKKMVEQGEKITNLNSHVTNIGDDLKKQGKHIKGIRKQQRGDAKKTEKTMKKQKQQTAEHQVHIGDFKLRVNNHGKLIGSNTAEVAKAQKEQEKAKKRQNIHEDELSKQQGVLTQVNKDVVALRGTQTERGKAIEANQTAHNHLVEKAEKRQKSYGIKFGTIDSALSGLHEKTGLNGGHLKENGQNLVTLGKHLEEAVRDRAEGHRLNVEQHDKNTLAMAGNQEKAKAHKGKHVQIEGKVKGIGENHEQLKTKMGKQRELDVKKFEDQGNTIKENAKHISGLKEKTGKNQQKLTAVHKHIGTTRTEMDETTDLAKEQEKTVIKHGSELTKNKEEYGHVHSELIKHSGEIKDVQSEQMQRGLDIAGVQANVDQSVARINSRIDKAVALTGEHKSQLKTNNETAQGHSGRLHGLKGKTNDHQIVLDHQHVRHVEQADQIKTIEGKFAQNSAEMEVVLRSRKEIAEALAGVQNAIASDVVASQKAVLSAAEQAAQNNQSTMQTLAEKMNIIAKMHEKEKELIKTHLLKEAAKDRANPEEYIDNQIEQTAVEAAQEAKEEQTL